MADPPLSENRRQRLRLILPALSEQRVTYPEHVREAICIPLVPDASASNLPALAPAQVAEAYFLNRPPSCDGAAHGEV